MNQIGSTKQKVGILVGGGPAPGVNGVITAATLAALRQGCEVVGIEDGFKWLVRGDIAHVRGLNADVVRAARLRGGSILHTSRENPSESPAKLQIAIESLQRLGITHLVTIGGDDTAFSACNTSRHPGATIRVAHVPKTIDNDLPLPDPVPTFGFHTARHRGAELVTSLREDARTTHRWHVVVTMGRSAGHLALGIGTAAGADLTLIPEELPRPGTSLQLLCEIIEGAMLKAKIQGQDYGVVVIAEGVAELMKDELKDHPLVVVAYDTFHNLRLAEVPLALILKRLLQKRAKQCASDAGFIDATLGYELRCADPIPFDVEYTQQLGWAAVLYLLSPPVSPDVERGALISIQDGRWAPIPFEQILNTETGKTKVRKVALTSLAYQCARDQMLRLTPSDLDTAERLQALAAASGLTPDAFRERYARAAECSPLAARKGTAEDCDKHDMAGVIQHSPEQFQAGLDAAAVPRESRSFTSVLVAGMGGSWMPAGLVAEAELARTPIRIHRDYGLPEDLDSTSTLVIAYSFSGNTEETLSAYEAAQQRDCHVIGISTGGKLADLCGRERPFIRIPADPASIQPRSATGYGVGILVGLLARYGLAAPQAEETVRNLGDVLADSMAAARRQGQTLAEQLQGSTPVIYASSKYATVARIWKIKFNENAKTPAFWNVLPELNHNEMTGWVKPHGHFHLVFLHDPDEDERLRQRHEVTRKVLTELQLNSTVIEMQGRSLCEKVFRTLLIGEWASYYTALALQVDPTPVDLVERFKRELERVRQAEL